MLRRLYHDQPASFAFTPANQAWAEAQITKYPEGRQASAIIPLLWRAQEQEGWLTRPAIEYVAEMLGMAYMRALEVASFYFMFQLQPVGSVAHIQICGTTTCMICGAEDLVAVCREKIADKPHALSADGKFSWEEVECLGSCANAPMAQIGKDYYEDLTAKRLGEIIDELAAGKVPVPGPQNGRYASEPLSGLTSLKDMDSGKTQYNASVQLAVDIGDTVKRIDGTEVPLTSPWQGKSGQGKSGQGKAAPKAAAPKTKAAPKAPAPDAAEKIAKPAAKPAATPAPAAGEGIKPKTMKAPRKAGADDLKLIKGVGPKLEALLHSMGFFHFDQIAKWSSEEVAWVDQNLEGFKGRVTRDDWVAQAAILADGGETEFSNRAKKGEV
ncbi:MAG: NADH-quinone oxidoreductase subunit E [Rhodobacterales bacterium]|nr:NADH-quinone oxidoreductase subunit E [Rhodobacterales bacterium]MDX5389476.1 NADH-quinone oxidoreductase subunit E [Rhodobacterales bacterium]MDX5489173.1 NADH-quinone oxidoreductase subunit E [Rhodobacterales bacterium]